MAAPTSDLALILRRYPYGESSLVVHALTPNHGQVHLLAKGAYRQKSGYSGVLDLFDTLALVWRRREDAELGTLVGASIERRRRAIAGDLGRYRAALALLELAHLAAQPDRADPGLFQLVERWLDLLCAPAPSPELALVAFDLCFLQNLGLSPALSACAACGRAASPSKDRRQPATAAFSAAAGGRLCPGCAQEASSAGRRVASIPVSLLRIAQSLLDAAPEHLSRFHLEERVLGDVRRLVQGFLDCHLETRPRSRRSQGRARAARPGARSNGRATP